MNIDLTGKIALVTGGSRGIGRECSMLLSNAGAKVIINYHKSGVKAEEIREELSQRGRESWIVQADIANPEEVSRLFEYVKKEFGKLDILVNNAGIIRDNLLLALELKDWNSVHDVNLRGPFLCTKYAVEMMMPNHSGKIINISSTGAIRGGRGQTNYASAKGGLVSFTRACAVELAGKGIQVNAILPGMIVTEMSSRVRKRAGEKILEKIPLARFGEPVDIAGLAVFLASDRADYITGQAIPVDGGMSIA
ncbi:MAG: 3-oxoacyl-ACP reductase FabG [Nitrospiraceae bacterium]|nr:MAG: 3-oxoacyl-ACP reductase FabG [Nitrospiraceae bacterium]